MAQAKSLTQQDIDTVLAYTASRSNAVRNRVMFLLTVLAGLRVSEVAQLTVADVRNKLPSILLQRTQRKTIILCFTHYVVYAKHLPHLHSHSTSITCTVVHECSVPVVIREDVHF